MKIKPFAVEEWMNELEDGAKYNIAETCVDSISLDDLFELTGENKDDFMQNICSTRLTYGSISGLLELKENICSLYKNLTPNNIITTHGAAGANHNIFYSLIEEGDHVISILPTYQQLYSIPESYKADMDLICLKKENDFVLDIEELKQLIRKETKVICINNPNNPTGFIFSNDTLKEIVEIAKEVDAYIVSDEVYRNLTQKDEYCESIVDLYEKGISVGSMSKSFSLAGLRLGWIATKSEEFLKSFISHRDYNMISCSLIDEKIATIALKHSEKILERSKKIVRENLEILDKWVNSEKNFSYVKPQAGTTALIFYDFDIDSYTFCKNLYDNTGVFTVPGDCFGIEKSFRVGYAYGKQVLIEGLNELSSYIQTLKK